MKAPRRMLWGTELEKTSPRWAEKLPAHPGQKPALRPNPHGDTAIRHPNGSNRVTSPRSSWWPGLYRDNDLLLLQMLLSPLPWASPREMFCWRNHPNLQKTPIF